MSSYLYGSNKTAMKIFGFSKSILSFVSIILFSVFFISCGKDASNDLPIEIGDNTTTESQPVKWKVKSHNEGDGIHSIYVLCYLYEGWHVYSQTLDPNDGPVPTEFSFELPDGYEKIGETIEGKPKVHYDPNFMKDLAFFDDVAIFKQKVKVTGELKDLKAGVYFMVCNDEMCLPPEFINFNGKTESQNYVWAQEGYEDVDARDISAILPTLDKVDLDNPVKDCGEVKSYDSTWKVFLFGFIGGLLALLTPCVFPMIPLTVSFFTKSGGGSFSGVFKAFLYGLFIFLIYAVLSIPFHFGIEPETLNEIATSATLNIIFFVIFVVFAISFFGYFEITLPSGLLNKADNASNIGGVVGIFFMALTLALVSFSCTGPILGTVLGNSLQNGPWPITAAMSGFGIALGLPFAFFAAFPSLLMNMPQSGGWLNTVKVILGFLELALAVKFLSNADLVYNWEFLHRETFFLIWTLIGLAMTLYLFGYIRFPHDSKIQKFSKFRIAFSVMVLAFTVYLAPGVLSSSPWNHNLLAGFPPPTFYSWYEKDTFHSEFNDFDKAFAYAKEVNKPLLVDFTGWACVNCRQMEETVWTVDKVKKILHDDFVLVSLYVDEKISLPEDVQGVYEYEHDGETIKTQIVTKGDKWAKFQTQYFQNNSQPYYAMISPDGQLLGNPIGYTPNVEEYLEYLECGLEANSEIEEDQTQIISFN